MNSTPADFANGDRKLRTACFRTPPLQILGNENLLKTAAEHVDKADFSVGAMSSGEAEAIGRLLPYLLCGEESAVHVFYRESRRARARASSFGQQLLFGIAGEEKVHEQMLARLGGELPEPDDAQTIRSRSHDFFVGLASRDPAVHFARVAALDSGVCKIMAALCGAPGVKKCASVHRVCSKVRHDESRHVRVSRRYVADLGLPAGELSGTYEQISVELVSLLQPAATAFENVGIDAEHLFRRIKREEI